MNLIFQTDKLEKNRKKKENGEIMGKNENKYENNDVIVENAVGVVEEEANFSITQFLIDNPIDNLTTEVIISERLRNFKFKLGVMKGAEFEEYRKQTNKIGKKGKIDYDGAKFQKLVIKNHCLVPNFKSKSNIEAAKCRTPEEFIENSLTSGELAELSQQILAFNGFDTDIEELTDQVKNS